MLKTLLRPKVIIPAVLGAGMLVVVLTVADAHKVLAIVLSFRREYLLYFFALMVVYTLLRCVQWHYLLDSLSIRVPIRAQVFSFAVGEITKSLPIGNYFQNYLLTLSRGTNFGLSSVATTLILLTEDVVCLIAILLLGVGPWSDWLRPAIVAGVLLVAVLVAIVYALRDAAYVPPWLTQHVFARRILNELRSYRRGARTLMRPRVLLVESLLSALYLFAAAVGLYCIVRGVGVTTITFWEVAAVYFFSLAVGLLIPIPVDLGLIELSGIGAFSVLGVGRSAAVAIMFINRLFSVVASTLIALLVMIVLHNELGRVLRKDARRRTHITAQAEREREAAYPL